MKKASKLFPRMVTMLLVVALLISAAPVYALGGGVQVETAPFQQFCGANIRLGGVDYLCAVDLGAPIVDSASDTAMTPGTKVRFELFFNINDTWYAARKQEMQGSPNEIFTLRFDKTAGGDRVSDPVWKTYPDDGYGERYYVEFTVLGGEADAAVDVTLALTQPASNNVGAAYRITGTSSAWESCVADFALPGYTGPCAVQFGGPVLSTSDAQNMTAGSTICFPLMFLGGDGQLYAAFNSELQGDPANLFSVEEVISTGELLLSSNGWKTWDNGHWYLEYAVSGAETAQELAMSLRLRQYDLYRASPWQSFTGKAPASASAPHCSLPIMLGGVVYDCGADLGTPITSSGTDVVAPGGTVRVPLMFMGGDGAWYAVREGELQGDPGSLLQTAISKQQLSDAQWVTIKEDDAGAKYYLQFTVTGEPGNTWQLSAKLRQPEKNLWGTTVTASGTVGQKELCIAPVSIGGTVYDCIVDLQGYLTSTGDTQNMTADTTICMPLMFLGGDGVWYPVLKNELQGDPEALFAISEVMTSGGALISCSGWKTWDNGHYFLEYKVADSQYETALDFTVTLCQDSIYRQGSPDRFQGTAPASNNPIWRQCKVPISIGGTVYDCVVDFQGYLTSSGDTTLAGGGVVCFPLMFLGGDGSWYPVLQGELQGDPAQLLDHKLEAASGGELLSCTGWKTWDNGHYFLEYQVADAEHETAVDMAVTLTQGSNYGEADRFAGTVPASEDPFWDTCHVPISIGGTTYLCGVDLRGYLLGAESADQMTAGSTVCFPLMFLGDDGSWYPVLQGELQGDPAQLLGHKLEAASGGELLSCTGWKTWDNGHYFLEYQVAETGRKTALDFAVTLKQADGTRQGLPASFQGTAPASNNPIWRQCKVPISIGGTVYDCVVDFQGYLTSSGDTTLAGGGAVCFPLMFLGGDGNWYPVLQNELQGDPNALFTWEETVVSGENLLKCNGWKTWDNGHYFLEYQVAETGRKTALDFAVTLKQADGTRQGLPASFQGTAPASNNPKYTKCMLPIRIAGKRYDCVVDLQGYLTSSGDTTLAGGGTVAFPLMFLGGDGVWYPVLESEARAKPGDKLSVDIVAAAGGELLTFNGWKTWDNGHYYAEFVVAPGEGDQTLEFSARLKQSGKQGAPVEFAGKVTAAAEQGDSDPCVAPILIGGTEYDCIVDLQGALTSSGSQTLEGGGTVALPLMFLGGDGVWYPVLQSELQGKPEELFTTTENLISGGELLSCTGWKTWDNGHYFLEYKVTAPKAETPLEFTVTLTQAGKQGVEDRFKGFAMPGPSISDQQIPMKNSASLVVERVEECQAFNTLSFTIAGVRYDDQWPIDFESPNTSSAVITDGTIIRSDLCFKVNGQWYPVRQQECNESVDELYTYAFEVLQGDDLLGVPRFTTRYDPYGDIWQFEVAVSSEDEGDFCFTLQLVAKDGSKLGSKYKVTGRVQNGEMSTTVEKVPDASNTGLWIGLGAGGVGLAGLAALLVVLLKKKKKGA